MTRVLAPIGAVLLALLCVLWPGKAEANVSCTITGMSINFGTGNTATGSLGYSCTNFNASNTVLIICSTLGTPSFPGTVAQPTMINGANELDFNLYTDAAYTSVWVGSTRLTAALSIPAGATATGSMPFYGAIPGGQSAPAGSYAASFFNTSLGRRQGGGICQLNGSGQGGFNGQDGTVFVTATVGNACTVSATDLSFGAVMATATNLAGSNTITVNCPTGTAYYIGLAPSNGSTIGAGTLTGTGGNTDQPPYQLRSTAGSSGTIWGNTATTTSVGNGVAGTGTGSAQNLPAYATMPSANYRPDSYSDTVTVRVNY